MKFVLFVLFTFTIIYNVDCNAIAKRNVEREGEPLEIQPNKQNKVSNTANETDTEMFPSEIDYNEFDRRPIRGNIFELFDRMMNSFRRSMQRSFDSMLNRFNATSEEMDKYPPNHNDTKTEIVEIDGKKYIKTVKTIVRTGDGSKAFAQGISWKPLEENNKETVSAEN